MDASKCLRKIKIIFENIFEGKIVLNDTDLDKILKFLEDRDPNGCGKKILETPDFSDLILHSLEKINNVSTPVQVFLIKIVTILFKNELQFSRMQMQGFQKLFREFCVHVNLSRSCSPNPRPSPSLYYACIHLATAEVSHSSGLDIILKNKVWDRVLYTELHCQPKNISNASYDFIAKLVWQLNDYEKESDLLEVLGYVVEPILSSGYLSVSVLDTETDTALANQVFASLSVLLAILKEAERYAPVNRVMTIIREYYITDRRLFQILRVTRNANLLKLLNSLIFRYVFQICRHLLSSNTDDFCNKLAAHHRNYIACAIRKREPFVIVDFTVQCNIIWSHFEKSHTNKFNFPMMFERNGQAIDFSIQILVHLIVPIVRYFRPYYSSNKIAIKDFVEEFIEKLGSTMTDYIYTCTFLFGEMLDAGCPTFRKKVTTHTLKELLRLKGHLNEAQAGLLFQSLYYLLEVFTLSGVSGGLVMSEKHMEPDDLSMLSHLLNVIKMLLKEYHISWCEHLEIVNIQSCLLHLLKQSFITTKLTVQIIDLITICIKRFLSPTMSLLLEDKCNTLKEIGEVIKLYMQNEDWEVRDSALNLLQNCTEICFIKYIPLQNMIKDKGLAIIAAKAALTDPEFYCQNTALKCLTAANRINSIWQDVIVDSPHIYLQLIHILKNHGEGMIRKEAVNVLKEVYINQKISLSLQSTLYKVMLVAALADLHWEVQLAALNFWRSAIQNQLTHRGMVDGKFPPVTFSKEKRKIITLNNAEIQRQLTGIMDHLSSIGCFTVLIGCMDEVHNIEVMDLAYRITKEFMDILDQYKYETVVDSVETPSVEIITKYEKVDTGAPTDLNSVTSEEEINKVIDSILSVDLSDLIIDLHDNYCKLKLEEMNINFLDSPNRDLVDRQNFLKKIRSNDYYSVIESKKNYYTDFSILERSLNELLDFQALK